MTTLNPVPPLPANFNDPAFRADPYSFYTRMRHAAPVASMKAIMGMQSWLITRYDDVVSALKDPRFSNDSKDKSGPDRMGAWWMPRMFKVLSNSMITCNDLAHQRLRGLVHLAFTPKRIERITARIEQVTSELLDAAGRKNAIDLIREFALPVPLTVISELMGVPAKEKMGFFNAVSPFLDSLTGSPLKILGQFPNATRLLRFFERMLALRRSDPQDDLISALVQGEQAGHETTVNLIGNATLALLEYPDQAAWLRQPPEMIDRAIDELLRYANPVEHGTNRILTEDVTLHGVRMPKHSTVLLMLAAANRDETAFPNADRLELNRNPNRHVGFGLGVHFCLGAPLARLEGKIAINALIQRFPNMQLMLRPEQVEWRTAVAVRGVKRLPVRLN